MHFENPKNLSKPQCLRSLHSHSLINPEKSEMTPIRSYLCDMTNNFRTCGDRKINITMKLTFIPTKDDDQDQLKHSKSNDWCWFLFPFCIGIK